MQITEKDRVLKSTLTKQHSGVLYGTLTLRTWPPHCVGGGTFTESSFLAEMSSVFLIEGQT